MGGDDSKKAILARRASFVAAALASTAIAADGCDKCNPWARPHPCLSVAMVDAGPSPCLTMTAEPPPVPPGADGGDASADAPMDAPRDARPDAAKTPPQAPPAPCLSMQPPKPPPSSDPP